MKRLFKSMLFIVLLTGVSCNTDDNFVDQIATESVTVSENLMAKNSIASANPYDYLGVLHNNFMTEMYNLSPSQDEIPALALDFVNQNGYETSYDYTTVSTIMNEAMNSQFTIEKIDELGERFQFSDNYKNELYKLVDFFNADNYNNPEDIVNRLKQIEESYINATNLTKEEEQNLLSIIAITRHSTNYWISFYPNDFNNQNNVTTTTARTRWWSRIFGGIVSDAFGAIIGSVVGGPVGTVVGAIAASGGIQAAIDDN